MVYNKLSEAKMGRRHVITDRIISAAENTMNYWSARSECK
jgi:hypothetical protein